MGPVALPEPNGDSLGSAEEQDHPGAVRSEPIGALTRLQIGRALSILGEKARAKSAYDDFFALWKDADPEIPVLQQAKAEYAALNSAE